MLVAICVVILTAGVLAVFAFPPFKLHFLAWVVFVPGLVLVKGLDRKRAFFAFYGAGVAFYLVSLWWLGQVRIFSSYIMLGLGVLVAYLALYYGIFGLGMRIVYERKLPFALAAPALWVLLEWVRGWAFTGFPWLWVGYSQAQCLPIMQAAAVGGVLFLSFLVIFVNGLVADFIVRGRKGFIYMAMITLLLVFAGGWMRLQSGEDGGGMRVALVQGNVPQEIKMNPAFEEDIKLLYKALTYEAAGRGAKIVVWPETAVPGVVEIQGNKGAEWVIDLAQETGVIIVAGAVVRFEDGYRNCVLVVDGKGIHDWYGKVHLVPFGEYTPLAGYLPFFEKFAPPGEGFVPGRGFHILEIGHLKFGPLVCYEAIFPAISRAFVRKGAKVLLNLTNDAWFGKTLAPYQHAAMASFRAVECGVPLLRVANTGVTLIASPYGRVEELEVGGERIFVQGILVRDLVLTQRRTLYSRAGDWIVWVAGLLILGCLLQPLTGMRGK